MKENLESSTSGLTLKLFSCPRLEENDEDGEGTDQEQEPTKDQVFKPQPQVTFGG